MKGSTFRNSQKFVLFVLFLFATTFLLKSEEQVGNDELLELLNTEVSTVSKYKQSVSEAPASVTVVTSEEIQRYGYKTMSELLNSVKSFFVRNDRQYFYTGTRGFERPSSYGNKILVLINGHTCNETIYQSTFYENEFGIDMKMIDRVEIVNGPGSVLYGTGAVLSVINIITKKGKQISGSRLNVELGNPGITKYRASMGYEFDNHLDITFSGTYGKSQGDDLYFKEYDSSSTNNGLAEDLDWEEHYGFISTINYGDLSFQTYFNRRDKGIPTAAWGMLFNQKDAYSIDERGFAEIKYEHDLSPNKNLMVRTYYDYYIYNASYPYNDGEGDSLYYAYDYNRGTWLGAESNFCWDISDYNRLSMGLEYKNNIKGLLRVWEDDGAVILNRNELFSVASVYIQDSYQMTEDFSVTAGLRYDKYSTAEGTLTPRLGLIYHPFESSTIKILYGESYRTANLYEKYYYYEGSELPNPNLKAERNRTHEFIWEEKFGKNIIGSVNIYYYTLHNLIDKVEFGDSSQFQNVDKVHAFGSELGAYTKITDYITCFLYLCYQKSIDGKTDDELTNTPQILIKSGISYEMIENFFVSTEVFYESKRKTLYGSYSDPFLMCNINFNFKPVFSLLFMNRFEFGFKITNLLDEKVRLPATFEHGQTLLEQYGRRFLFNFSIFI